MTIFLGFRNRLDAATLSGGSWSSLLPRNNLKTRELEEVARTTDATTASAVINIDLGDVYPLRVVTLHNHNLSQTGSWRVKLGTTSGGSEIYSGPWQAAWFLDFDDPHTPWEAGAWWTTPDTDYRRHPFLAPIMLPAGSAARYVRIEFDDTANADGYIQIGRAFIGDGLQPELGPVYGLQDGWRDLSGVVYADGGADFIYRRQRRRWVRFDLAHLNQDREFSRFHEFLRRVGTVEEVLYLPSLTDYQACQRTGFLGLLEELSPIEYPRYKGRSLALQMQERL